MKKKRRGPAKRPNQTGRNQAGPIAYDISQSVHLRSSVGLYFAIFGTRISLTDKVDKLRYALSKIGQTQHAMLNMTKLQITGIKHGT
jgi:hypothetical protein